MYCRKHVKEVSFGAHKCIVCLSTDLHHLVLMDSHRVSAASDVPEYHSYWLDVGKNPPLAPQSLPWWCWWQTRAGLKMEKKRLDLIQIKCWHMCINYNNYLVIDLPYSVLRPHSFTLFASYWAFFFKRQALQTHSRQLQPGSCLVLDRWVLFYLNTQVCTGFTWMPACSSLCGTVAERSEAARSPGSGHWSPCSACGARCLFAAVCVDWESGLPHPCGEISSACTSLWNSALEIKFIILSCTNIVLSTTFSTVDLILLHLQIEDLRWAIPCSGPFFWYRLLGSVCLSHSEGFSMRSCLEGGSCSLYSQK